MLGAYHVRRPARPKLIGQSLRTPLGRRGLEDVHAPEVIGGIRALTGHVVGIFQDALLDRRWREGARGGVRLDDRRLAGDEGGCEAGARANEILILLTGA